VDTHALTNTTGTMKRAKSENNADGDDNAKDSGNSNSNEHTFWGDILAAAVREGEEIESVVIGDPMWGFRKEDTVPKEKKYKLMTPEEAKQYLNYRYYPGFGGPECHDIWAWSQKRVYFVHEYDGSTGIRAMYRNPTDMSNDN